MPKTPPELRSTQEKKQARAAYEKSVARGRKPLSLMTKRGEKGQRNGIETRNKRKRREQRQRSQGQEVW